MNSTETELMNIVDELASAAASLSQGAQSYDTFIRARESCKRKLEEHFEKRKEISLAIEKLYKLL